jgi:Ca-activated chloride channel family protein
MKNSGNEHPSFREAAEQTARALDASGALDDLPQAGKQKATREAAATTEAGPHIDRIRQLGRLIRNASAVDAERWNDPQQARDLRELIESELGSATLQKDSGNVAESGAKTSSVRLAALAATLLLLAAIGFLLIQQPRFRSVMDIANHLIAMDFGHKGSVLEPGSDRASGTEVKLSPLSLDQRTTREQPTGGGSTELAGQKALPAASAPANLPIASANGTTVQLPRFAGTTVTSTVDVPDGGTVIIGGIVSGPEIIAAVDGSSLRIPESKTLSQGPSGQPVDRPSLATGVPLAAGNPGKQDMYYIGGSKSPVPNGNSAGAPAEGWFEDSGVFYGTPAADNGIDSSKPAAVEDRLALHMEIPDGRNVDRDVERQSAEQYELPPENRFLKPVGERALSTFSIDVDTASYANMRRFITGGQLPPRDAIRIEELINYFSYDYPAPVDGKPFSVSLDVATCPWQPAHKLVRVGLLGKPMARDERPASNLVFLIDVSGSMKDENKLPLLQRSLLMLVDQLTENDRVSIVTYADHAGIRLQPTSGDQKQVIRDVINQLSADGSTHGSAGIATAYELAAEHFVESGTNRVLLATDGDLNVGITEDDDLVQLIRSRAESGVFLSVLGFGTGNLKDGKLEKIADNGNGHYSYIDSIREAQKVLVAEMSGSLVTIARDVKLQIEFNPAVVAGYRLIGYENRALQNEDFVNDRVDAGDIGAGHSVTALYEIVPVAAEPNAVTAPVGMRYQRSQASDTGLFAEIDKERLTDAAQSGELMNVALRFKQPESRESQLLEVTVKDTNQSFEAAPADFRFAASVAAFGMKLRQSAYAGSWSWSDIENAAAGSIGVDQQGHRAEMVDLVRQTRQLLGR